MSKKIILKSLAFKNFKGIKALIINCNSKITNIFGDNGTGKTTVFDGFTWVLFDKDSSDISKFTVQPLDENNNIIHMLETEVTAVLEIDGVSITLKKLLKEKWTKKKGEVESELKGTTTSYYVNDVPHKQGEYQKKINEIIPENIFKLLTNPLYFSSVMKWTDRRKIIFELNNDVTIEEVINSKSELKDLAALLNPNEDTESFNKRIKSQKSKLVKDKESIPYRVDELNKSMKNDIDFETLEFRKKGILSDLKSIEEKMLDSSKANEDTLKDSDKLYQLKSELQSIRHKAENEADKPLKILKSQLDNIRFELNSKQNQLNYKEKEVQRIKLDIETQEKLKENLKKQWYEEDAKQFEFDEKLGICPVCKRRFEEHDIETKKQELLENFNKTKAENLAKITKLGQGKNAIIADLQEKLSSIDVDVLKDEIESLITQRDKLNKEIENFSSVVDLDNIPEYQGKLKEINELESKVNQPAQTNSHLNDLKEQKNKLQSELESVNSSLNYKSTNEETLSRILELQEKEKTLAQQIANLEKAEYLAETFIKTKVELLESSINSKFKYVKFKLFDTQVNGGINECCEVLVNGVPFNTNLNNAARINAGLDIINTLSKHYGVQAPIFIDNKESVTRLIDTESQVINLIVSEEDKRLRIGDELILKASEQEEKELNELIDKLNAETGSYTTSAENIDSFPEEAVSIKKKIVDQRRWSVTKVEIFKYKNLYFAASWDDPATEMQEGQETNFKVYKVNPVKKEVLDFM